jgi:hypothetical protein
MLQCRIEDEAHDLTLTLLKYWNLIDRTWRHCCEKWLPILNDKSSAGSMYFSTCFNRDAMVRTTQLVQEGFVRFRNPRRAERGAPKRTFNVDP